VFSAFLLIVGVTATGQSMLVTADSSTVLISNTVGSDAATIRSFVTLNLSPDDLDGSLAADRQLRLDKGLSLLTGSGGVMQAVLLLPDGTVLAASDPAWVGKVAPRTAGFEDALRRKAVAAAMVRADESGALATLAATDVIEAYFPIIADGQTFAVAAVWRDAAPLLAQLEQSRIRIVAVVLAAGIISLVLLFFVFRAAQQRLTRQSIQLIEATRRDALTGSLNHGALVESLTTSVDHARAAGTGAVGVALIDFDNLGLLNNTYSHADGDRALLAVAGLIETAFEERGTWGRYGPDEFLIIVEGTEVAMLPERLDAVRAALVDFGLTVDASERLPLTVSVGIASYPTDGLSVTTLLATASVTLDEAKASGGDAVRTAGAARPRENDSAGFDVLEGLVIAVDTKDRYTRRHSEDVARYGGFLASQLGLDADFRRIVQRAGRLHDVGKIGIPDHILRKPGALTPSEYEIVKQHVNLGDLIARDLPDQELVRAGIRHHHERWDGKGYLHGLAGEDIPLIARILAVGDAFSAMTTTRPYRKALSVEEALTRLEDASGSQLDASLVLAFVAGIRSAPNPPLPGELLAWQAARDLLAVSA
jgi:diguanylate cyclase (GGDEF)-like protein